MVRTYNVSSSSLSHTHTHTLFSFCTFFLYLPLSSFSLFLSISSLLSDVVGSINRKWYFSTDSKYICDSASACVTPQELMMQWWCCAIYTHSCMLSLSPSLLNPLLSSCSLIFECNERKRSTCYLTVTFGLSV